MCVCGAKADLGQIPGLLGFRAIGFRPKEIRISGKQERERKRKREAPLPPTQRLSKTTRSNSPSREISSRRFSIDRSILLRKWNALAARIRQEAGYNAIQWITKEKRSVGEGWVDVCAPFHFRNAAVRAILGNFDSLADLSWTERREVYEFGGR